MTHPIKVLSFSVIVAAVLSACGGGGSTPSAAAPPAITGKVIDGYIEGALVCLDLNVNQTCDGNEPSATSQAGGNYSLDTTGLTAEALKSAHLLTVVPETAFDADDAVGGVKKTLAEAGKPAFKLMAPVSAFMSADGARFNPAVVSPLTTMISYDMIVETGNSLAHSMSAVRVRMGLKTDTDLTQDFVDKKNTELHEQAKVVAAALGQIIKETKLVADATDRASFLSALQYIQKNAAELQKAAKNANGDSVKEKVKAALETPNLARVPGDLIKEANHFTQSQSVNITAALKDGVYAYFAEGYMKISATENQWMARAFLAQNAVWSEVFNDSGLMSLSAKGWVYATNKGAYSSDAGAGITLTQEATNVSNRPRARLLELRGNLATNYPELLSLLAPRSNQNSKIDLDSGSLVYLVNYMSLTDEYTLNSIPVLDWQGSLSSQTPLPSLAALIAAYPTINLSSSTSKKLSIAKDLAITFDSIPANSLLGTVTLWSMDASTKIGVTTFEIKTIFGKEIMIINADKPQKPGARPTFSARDGVVYSGEYLPLGFNAATEFYFNKTAINSILRGLALPAVLN